ncbi:hypothetical protein Q7C36_002717 [Tachysurus vachellii]|uniref:Uncharacterized protein n=1 Tax=Tachysurus vachellii TaxID=175792 RepID=A0AA88TH88_TACVA|nr:hypothetical protein Q7C36_002717 [Tachysurus vachellii]
MGGVSELLFRTVPVMSWKHTTEGRWIVARLNSNGASASPADQLVLALQKCHDPETLRGSGMGEEKGGVGGGRGLIHFKGRLQDERIAFICRVNPPSIRSPSTTRPCPQ